MADRARRQYQRLSSSIASYKYEDSDEEDLEQATPVPIENNEKNNYLENNKINESFESDASEKLLDKSADDLDNEFEKLAKKSVSADDSLNQSIASVSSRRSSVTSKKNKKGFNFKYKTCSICLSDFSKGEKIRVIPNCGHTFHHQCLE